MQPKRVRKRSKKSIELRLFVAGSGTRSLRWIETVTRACEKHAPGNYHLSVVDIYLQPEEAVKAQIVAAPTLIHQYPAPVRMFVGESHGPAALDRQFAWLSAVG